MTQGGAETIGRCLTIFLSIATARALVPEQVGVLGISAIVVGLISMVGSYGETAAVVSSGRDRDEDYALVACLGRGALTIVLIVILLVVLPPLSGWLVGGGTSSMQLGSLVRLLLWQPLIEAFGAYPRVLLQRRLDLVVLAGINLLQVVSHVALAVVLLWSGLGALAVVWGALVGASLAAILSWTRLVRSPFASWRYPSRGVLHVFAGNFAKVFANGFLTYVNAQIDKLLVSGILGPTAMGFYGMASNASRFPAMVLAQSLRFSLLPAVARLQDDRAAVERALLESLRHSILLAGPVAALLFVSAPSLVSVILGQQWLPVVPALRVMSVIVMLAPVLETAATLVIGMGQAHLTAISSALSIMVLVVITPLLATQFGVVGAAYANLASFIVLTASLAFVARFAFAGIRWLRIGSLLRPLSAAAVAALAAFALGQARGVGLGRLVVEATTLFALYPLAVSLLGGREALFDLIELIRRSWSETGVAAASSRGR